MLAIRADGNSLLGTGHIMRCLSIAKAARRLGEDCVFWLADGEAKALLEGSGFAVEVLGSDYRHMLGEREALEAVWSRYRPQRVLVDSYYVEPSYFAYLRQMESRAGIAYIDDLLEGVYDCDLLLHYAVDGEERRSWYEKRYIEAGLPCPQLLLGPSFVPLREEFARVTEREFAEHISRVLVLTGGSDVSHTGLALLEFLEQNPQFAGWEMDFVAGRLNLDLEAMERKAHNLPRAHIHAHIEDMRSRMELADIAISAGGSTLYELCACGTPMVMYTCADNQQQGAKAISRAVGAPYVGDARGAESFARRLMEAVVSLAADGAKRREQSRVQRELVDGRGAERICRRLLDMEIPA